MLNASRLCRRGIHSIRKQKTDYFDFQMMFQHLQRQIAVATDEIISHAAAPSSSGMAKIPEIN
jgi:hypothetical protein